MKIIKLLFLKLFLSGSTRNERKIILLTNKYGKAGKWLDLGCDDGSWTRKLTKKSVQWHGIEVVEERAASATKNGIKVKTTSLEHRLPYRTNTFDLVHSNQVIEHLNNVDNFLSEIYRVLKPSGILIVSTENPASWHNIFAMIAGWQMFSQTNISTRKRSIGNPFSIFSNENFVFNSDSSNYAWIHQKLFTPRALKELLVAHNFKLLESQGSGYHPLPASLARFDINHSHFYVIAAKK